VDNLFDSETNRKVGASKLYLKVLWQITLIGVIPIGLSIYFDDWLVVLDLLIVDGCIISPLLIAKARRAKARQALFERMREMHRNHEAD
jgi:hypothetical protein